MRFLRGLLAAFLLLCTMVVGVSWTSPAAADQGSDERYLVDALNGVRAGRGLHPLAVDGALTQIARTWSATMATTGVLAHNPAMPGPMPSGWTSWGENVGYASTAQAVHNALVASPTHLANIVKPGFNAVGVGVAYSSGRIWVTQVFGTLPSVSPAPAPVIEPSGPVTPGPWYRTAAASGAVSTFGGRNGLPQIGASSPVVAVASTPSGNGYFLAGADGSVYTAGDAVFRGGANSVRLAAPIVGMAATPTGNGYWLLGRDGGVFSFGDAAFFGSTGNIRLNQPVVGMAATPTGRGYWFVASDGGVFSFGDARFFGSTGNIRLNQPVVGMASAPRGSGYWLVARDGGIFAFGTAQFHGSTGNIRLNQPVVGMAATSSGNGYRFVAADGGIFTFGDAPFFGSSGGAGSSVVGIISGG